MRSLPKANVMMTRLDALIFEVSQRVERIVKAIEVFASGVQCFGQAAVKATEVYDRINKELEGPEMADCDECDIAHATDEIFETSWGSNVCRKCWSSVTNDAPLPDQVL